MRWMIHFLLYALCVLPATADTAPFPGKKSAFHGYTMYQDEGRYVVVPKKEAQGRPWVWRARFWGHQPQFDLAMLEKGYHLVYCNVAGLFGSPKAVERWDAFYKTLTTEYGFAPKPVLEGFSRGGLIVYNWAARNPGKVSAIYGDAPVMDFKSWPGINKKIMEVYELESEEAARAYPGNPVNNLGPLAKAGVPIIHVVGDADRTVSVAENTTVAEEAYKKLGGRFHVIHKPGVDHHPHSLKDPAPIVEFIETHGLK